MCQIADCQKPAQHRGWCTTHYKRWWRHGDPTYTVDSRTREERFDEKWIETPSGCWEWQAFRDPGGYGRFGISAGVSYLAHRYAHERWVGPITEETLDHLCRNPACVNPDHLEPVSLAENSRRAALARN